ncbi:RNA-directed DNA polymerase [Gordonia McavH-238-E]|uniref:RNA-directed DNA polymerase n=1 Tax=Gordonia sp. McavH-238-E TaxID=2917736 RepID=UPI001EF4FF9B|nr:RNA-directed DNA polymerase [Gordonia sp. McavH-238-E]MCG7632234.1 RNA-directed DNA polymerase [Gordonia sp. McavH-238-E]
MLLTASLQRGYLPREIPLAFSSDSLSKALPRLTAPKPSYPVQATRFSIARVGGTRRSTEIPNPFAQFHVSNICAANWDKLQRITARSPVSLGRPVRRKAAYRSLVGRATQGKTRQLETMSRIPGGRFTIKTDISQFYPSIYTHAVDWAIRGKSKAKANRRVKCLGSELDKFLRNCRDGQTVGIPIGPDTSWIVSEIILARVDEYMAKNPSFGSWFASHAYRFGDDMTVFAKTHDQAAEILGEYEIALARYELSLNPLKVGISTGIEMPEQPWVSQLRNARYRDDNDSNLSNDVVELFSQAFEMSRVRPDIGALSYAIKRCDPFPAGDHSWPLYRDCVLASAVQEPSSLRHVHQVMSFAKDRGLDASDDLTCEVLNQICEEHAPLDHGFEVAWALATLQRLELPLDASVAQKVAAMDDNCSLILLSHEVSQRPVSLAGVDLSTLRRRAESDGALSSDDWLLAYESRARKWCSPRKWDGEPAWKELAAQKVRFLAAESSPKPKLRRRRPEFIPSWGAS